MGVASLLVVSGIKPYIERLTTSLLCTLTVYSCVGICQCSQQLGTYSICSWMKVESSHISPISRMVYLDESIVWGCVWQGGEVRRNEGQWKGSETHTGDDKRATWRQRRDMRLRSSRGGCGEKREVE